MAADPFFLALFADGRGADGFEAVEEEEEEEVEAPYVSRMSSRVRDLAAASVGGRGLQSCAARCLWDRGR